MDLSRLCWVIPFALFVTGCEAFRADEPRAPVIQTEVRIPVVDPRALVCPTIPIPPDPDTATQRDIAAYIPSLIEVAEHCKQDLGTVRATLSAAQAAADAANEQDK